MDGMITRAILFTLLLATVSAADRQDDDLHRRLALLEQRYARDMQIMEERVVHSVQRRLGLLEQRYTRDMQRLEERVVTLETANHQLVTENDDIKARMDALENRVEQSHKLNELNVASEAVGANEDTSHLEESSTRKGAIARQGADDLNGTMKQPERNNKRALVEGANIAFTAYVDHDLNKQGPNEVVIFNKVLLNHGNAYNNFSGMFTAPMAGVYSFTFFIGQRGVNQFRVRLMVNDQHQVDAVTEAFHATQDTQGGNTANLLLSQGDVVSVRHFTVGSHLEGDSARRITTFSGFLIYPVEDPRIIIGK